MAFPDLNFRLLAIPCLILALQLFGAPSAHAAQRFSACAKMKGFQTQVVIDLETPPPSIDLRMTRKQMNANQAAVHESWIKLNQMQTVWTADRMETLGQAAGGWSMMTQQRNVAKPYDNFGADYCPYFGKIELHMMYRTIINLPKEFKPRSCAYNLVMEHEMRHHQTNVTVAQEVVARLRKDLPLIVEEIERSSSYVPRGKVDARFKFMQQSVESAVTVYVTETMQKEMQRRNRLIDSPAEYERTSKAMRACDD